MVRKEASTEGTFLRRNCQDLMTNWLPGQIPSSKNLLLSLLHFFVFWSQKENHTRFTS